MNGMVPQGSTMPIYVRLAPRNGPPVDGIAKFCLYENRLKPVHVLNEWIAINVARTIGLRVSDAYLLNLAREHVDTLASKRLTCSSEPLGFGTKRDSLVSIPNSISPLFFDRNEVARLYIFDLLMLNSDRTAENGNCGVDGDGLHPFDFGASLPVDVPLQGFERFFFGSHLRDRAENHLCRNWLPSENILNNELRRTLDILGSTCVPDLALLAASIEPSWQPSVEMAKSYVEFLYVEQRMIVQQVQTVF